MAAGSNKGRSNPEQKREVQAEDSGDDLGAADAGLEARMLEHSGLAGGQGPQNRLMAWTWESPKGSQGRLRV